MAAFHACVAAVAGWGCVLALACKPPQPTTGAGAHPTPDTVQVGEVASACQWPVPSGADSHGMLVLDIVFQEHDTLPHRGPSAADQAIITAVDGEILDHFHVRAVRARLRAQRVPQLRQKVNAALYVPDPRRHDLRVMVTYTRAPTDADGARLRELGGRVLAPMLTFNAIVAVLPDDAMRHLWARPEVWRIEPDGIACLL